ncbi:MAG: hypothetical protein IJN79_08030 [Clostridia bacterium]|nr:hypothetical protein [Clostridia bacterium]
MHITRTITREHITDLQILSYVGFRELTDDEKRDIACWDAFEQTFRASNPGAFLPAAITVAG